MISRFRAPVDILGVTTSDIAIRKLAMSWAVVPAMSMEYTSTDVLFYVATQLAREKLGLKSSDKIVINGGVTNGKSGNTDLIKVEVIRLPGGGGSEPPPFLSHISNALTGTGIIRIPSMPTVSGGDCWTVTWDTITIDIGLLGTSHLTNKPIERCT